MFTDIFEQVPGIESQLLGTAAVIPDLETTLRQLKNALSVLLGRNPGGVDDILKGEGSLPAIPETIATGIPADQLRQRPDVRRAELQALATVGVRALSHPPSQQPTRLRKLLWLLRERGVPEACRTVWKELSRGR